MFGPEGRPQHCCAWLGVASSFPECASATVPEEVFSTLYNTDVSNAMSLRIVNRVLAHGLVICIRMERI